MQAIAKCVRTNGLRRPLLAASANSLAMGGLLNPSTPTSKTASSVPAVLGIHPTGSETGERAWMNLHEYQSKDLMTKYGVNTQKQGVAETAEEAVAVAKSLDGELVIKAQVHAGGRGKGHFEPNGFKGGVHVVDTPEQVGEIAAQMLGQNLITKQTPPAGVLVNKVMIAESVNITRELYFAILMDRAFNGPVLVASQRGGVNIEEVAEEEPEAIFKVPVDINTGVTREQSTGLAAKLGFEGAKVEDVATQIENLYSLFIATDATQVEINPLAETDTGKVYCIDAKIGFDDNAAYRQKDIFSQADTKEEDPREVEAAKYGLNYVGMDGNIGCMVNGAGLAMATMDIIKLHGAEPANFLDVGGGADEDTVAAAFRILVSDSAVKAILVNIFAGIMRCDTIAAGIVAGAKQVDLKIPLVVRLAGTNEELGKKILSESGLAIVAADDLDDAAKKAVSSL